MGRPSKYDLAFCDQVVALGREGKSKAQIAAALDVDRATIDRWAESHPEFCSAIARARDLALAWWEEVGQSGMFHADKGTKLNPQLWSRSMAARFPDDYRENKGVELTGKGGGALQAQVVIATGVPQPGEDLV